MKVEIHSDGGSKGNPGPGYGQIVININYERHMTNNEAEYLALLDTARIVMHLANFWNIKRIYSDSKLAVNQISGEWRVNKEEFKDWINLIRKVLHTYDVELCWLPREKLEADAR